jgi:hypothetical protein
LYNIIKKQDEETQLVKYEGRPLKSFTTEIKVIGKVILKQCIFNNSNTSTNIELIVTEDQQCLNKCIIGTDLMSKIPIFKNLLDQVEATIKTISDDIKHQYNQKSFHDQKEYKQIYNINESLSLNITHIEKTEVPLNKINQVRDNLKVKLTEFSASELVDIIPKAKTRVEFKIQLINPKQ